MGRSAFATDKSLLGFLLKIVLKPALKKSASPSPSQVRVKDGVCGGVQSGGVGQIRAVGIGPYYQG